MNLQDVFLDRLRKENVQVVIYLVSGFQLKGVIKGYDNFTIFLEIPEGKLQMIYKHSVSTIHPLKGFPPAFLEETIQKLSQKK